MTANVSYFIRFSSNPCSNMMPSHTLGLALFKATEACLANHEDAYIYASTGEYIGRCRYMTPDRRRESGKDEIHLEFTYQGTASFSISHAGKDSLALIRRKLAAAAYTGEQFALTSVGQIVNEQA